MSARPSPTLWQRFLLELRANPKKARILAVLVPVLAAAWMPILRGGSDEIVLPHAESAVAGAAPSRSARRVDLGSVQRLRPRLERLRVPEVPALEPRSPIDPFASRRGAEEGEPSSAGESNAHTAAPRGEASEAEREAAAAAALVLGGTFLSPGRPAAARIEGQLVQAGALFGVFALEEVGSRWVSLRGRHGRYKLEMKSGRGGG